MSFVADLYWLAFVSRRQNGVWWLLPLCSSVYEYMSRYWGGRKFYWVISLLFLHGLPLCHVALAIPYSINWGYLLLDGRMSRNSSQWTLTLEKQLKYSRFLFWRLELMTDNLRIGVTVLYRFMASESRFFVLLLQPYTFFSTTTTDSVVRCHCVHDFNICYCHLFECILLWTNLLQLVWDPPFTTLTVGLSARRTNALTPLH